MVKHVVGKSTAIMAFTLDFASIMTKFMAVTLIWKFKLWRLKAIDK